MIKAVAKYASKTGSVFMKYLVLLILAARAIISGDTRAAYSGTKRGSIRGHTVWFFNTASQSLESAFMIYCEIAIPVCSSECRRINR